VKLPLKESSPELKKSPIENQIKIENKKINTFFIKELNSFLEEIKSTKEWNHLLFLEEIESQIDRDCLSFLTYFN
jgi:hypothetical protein